MFLRFLTQQLNVGAIPAGGEQQGGQSGVPDCHMSHVVNMLA